MILGVSIHWDQPLRILRISRGSGKKSRVDVVTKSCNLFVSGLTNSEIRFGGSSEPLVSIKAMTINLFSSIETSSSKNANPISSSDRSDKWRPNAVVAASATFLFGQSDRVYSYSKFRSFLGADADDGLWNQYLIYTPVIKRRTSLRCFSFVCDVRDNTTFVIFWIQAATAHIVCGIATSSRSINGSSHPSGTMNCSWVLKPDSTRRCSTQENN